MVEDRVAGAFSDDAAPCVIPAGADRSRSRLSLPTRRTILAPLALGTLAFPALAQGTWPSRPIRIVTIFVAGGAGDTAIRALSARVSEFLGQSVVIESRPGGKGVIAASAVHQAPPDGYTFLLDAANSLTNPILSRDLPLDYATAFVPVTMTARFPQGLAVPANSPLRTIADFVAHARANPGNVSCGTPPVAGAGHLAVEMLRLKGDVQLLHVSYRGGAEAIRDLLGGRLDCAILATGTLSTPAEAGRVRLLAVTSGQRSPAYPDVPTLAESGFPDIDIDDWNGLFAGAGVPATIVPRMQEALAHAAADPHVRAQMAPLGTVLVANRPDEFAAWLGRQRGVLRAIIEEAQIRLE